MAGVSTKRESKDQIGYWGLGSKSPLAYTNNFFLTTVFNKVKYSYLIYKGNSPIPEIQLLDEEETDERNGTTVKIVIKKVSDEDLFQEAVVKQLKYFDNVYVKGHDSFDNSYTIIEGEHYKFRTDIGRSVMHLVLGKVTYPINWEYLGISPIHLPIGLKFAIGDLPITPERESVNYITIERDGQPDLVVKDVILAKIKDVYSELQAKLDGVNSEYNNLIDWLEAKEKLHVVTIGGVDIPISGTKLVHKTPIYTPCKDIGAVSPSKFPFYHVHVSKLYRHGAFVRSTNDLSINQLSEYFLVRQNKPVSRYKKMVLDYLEHLARIEKKPLAFVESRDYDIKNAYRQVYPIKVISQRDFSRTNRLSNWKRYLNVMNKELIFNSISYFDVEVPADFEANWIAANKTKETVVLGTDEIAIEDFKIKNKVLRKYAIKINDLNDFKAILYSTNDADGLDQWAELIFKYYPEHLSVIPRDKTIAVLKIKARDEKHFIALPKSINIASLMTPNPIFVKIATAGIVSKSKIWNYKFRAHRMSSQADTQFMFDYIFSPLGDTVKKLKTSSVLNLNVNQSTIESTELEKAIVELAETNDWIDQEVKVDMTKVERYLDGLELINYIVDAKEALPHVAKFVKAAGKKVNPEWDGLTEWQIQLIEDSLRKQQYFKYLAAFSDIGYSRKRETQLKRREFYNTLSNKVGVCTSEYNIFYKG